MSRGLRQYGDTDKGMDKWMGGSEGCVLGYRLTRRRPSDRGEKLVVICGVPGIE